MCVNVHWCAQATKINLTEKNKLYTDKNLHYQKYSNKYHTGYQSLSCPFEDKWSTLYCIRILIFTSTVCKVYSRKTLMKFSSWELQMGSDSKWKRGTFIYSASSGKKSFSLLYRHLCEIASKKLLGYKTDSAVTLPLNLSCLN